MTKIAQKLGFSSLISIVIGSQIGSSVFMLPSELAGYGYYNIIGWLMTGVAAIVLASVFALLASRFPKTGGPHVFSQAAFGKTVAFYSGWTYWVISWFSSTAVIITAIEYLLPIFGNVTNTTATAMQISLILVIMWVNLRGVCAAGRTEILLTCLKCIPLLIIPITALFYFQSDYLIIEPTIQKRAPGSVMSELALLMLWGFVGLECATAPAGSVIKPRTTVPLAIITGTAIVAVTYLINSIALMGIIPPNELQLMTAPYVDVSQILFGGDWYILMAIITSIVCIGTLNAWVLTSGQIALGLAQDKLLPPNFAVLNKFDAPKLGIVLSCMGTIPFLIFLDASSIRNIVEYSGVAFLFVYLISAIALAKLQIDWNAPHYQRVVPLIAGVFCLWVLGNTNLKTIALSCLFILSGTPIRLYLRASSEVN